MKRRASFPLVCLSRAPSWSRTTRARCVTPSSLIYLPRPREDPRVPTRRRSLAPPFPAGASTRNYPRPAPPPPRNIPAGTRSAPLRSGTSALSEHLAYSTSAYFFDVKDYFYSTSAPPFLDVGDHLARIRPSRPASHRRFPSSSVARKSACRTLASKIWPFVRGFAPTTGAAKHVLELSFIRPCCIVPRLFFLNSLSASRGRLVGCPDRSGKGLRAPQPS